MCIRDRGESLSQTGSFVNYIEAASAFVEGRSTEDRVAYMFSVFDKDLDGYLGIEDLQAAVGPCSDEEIKALVAEIGGDALLGVTCEALVEYVKLHPEVEQGLVMRSEAAANQGIASQLATRPLILLALKSCATVEDFIKSLDKFGQTGSLEKKLDKVFNVLDEDGDERLTLEEVALLSRECSGEEVQVIIHRLNDWIKSNGNHDSTKAYISRQEFLQFAMTSLPGVDQALTITF
eukprot:TRINITY_DN44765_c0_g1_i1.p1 TRINITY_DN44765_c0_g1~~TRINITY_DN44765_c0_g1_i1.p1  ORF type:complete len:235 (-),score=61.79 TRINITY_DN44765_c0_g1_i1:399-1103(-)